MRSHLLCQFGGFLILLKEQHPDHSAQHSQRGDQAGHIDVAGKQPAELIDHQGNRIGETYANLAASFTGIAAYAFLVFNLLCAPCFAAIGAIRREMNNAGWTWFAIAYQCGFAYAVALMIYQFGGLFTGSVSVIGLIAALAVLGGMIWMLFFKKYQEATKLTRKV